MVERYWKIILSSFTSNSDYLMTEITFQLDEIHLLASGVIPASLAIQIGLSHSDRAIGTSKEFLVDEKL